MENVPSAHDVTELMREANNLKASAMVFLGIIVALGLAFWLIWRWLEKKENISKEKYKNERNDKFLATLNKFSKSIELHTARDEDRDALLLSTLEGVKSSMDSVQVCVSGLNNKVTGVINKDDSIRMVRDRFIQNVYREFCMVIQTSLTENDYIGRKDYVTRHVKTELGKILVESRTYLASFKLELDVQKFFVRASNSSIERFILCDEVWSVVEFLFRRETHGPNELKQKIEEAFLLLQNTITDYVTRCCQGTDVRIDFRQAPDSSSSHSMMRKTTRLMESGAQDRMAEASGGSN